MTAARQRSHRTGESPILIMHSAQEHAGNTTRRRIVTRRTRTYLISVLLLSMMALPLLAQEQPSQTVAQYNVLITDGATGFLASCVKVRVYSVDPVENVRLAADPVVELPSKAYPTQADPILLQLAPGRYELVVCMSWLTTEVHYMYFTVVDGAVATVSLLSVELPAELLTY